MDRICKSCKWWKAPDDARDVSWGQCLLTESRNSTATHETTCAVADAYSGGMAVLMTRGVFGCTQHEPRDEEHR